MICEYFAIINNVNVFVIWFIICIKCSARTWAWVHEIANLKLFFLVIDTFANAMANLHVVNIVELGA